MTREVHKTVTKDATGRMTVKKTVSKDRPRKSVEKEVTREFGGDEPKVKSRTKTVHKK